MKTLDPKSLWLHGGKITTDARKTQQMQGQSDGNIRIKYVHFNTKQEVDANKLQCAITKWRAEKQPREQLQPLNLPTNAQHTTGT